MSRRLLWTLAAFMAVIMLGLILVQSYWINNAIDIKEKQFNQLVNRALSNISYEMEKDETVYYISNHFNSVRHYDSAEFRYDLNVRIESKPNLAYRYNTGGDGYIISRKGNANNEGNLVISLSDDSVKNLVMTENGLDTFWQEQPKQIIKLPDPDLVKSRIQDRQVLIEQVVSKMMNPDTEIESRLPRDLLENVIKTRFGEMGLDLNYEYAVIKNSNKIAYQSQNFKPDKTSRIYTVQLFPRDIWNHSDYLRVYFPGERNFIMKSVGFMGMTSVFLTMIIIGIFVFTLWIIFRQKKLSEMKSDFVNNMTHELKTPISTISLASQMLNDNSIPAENKNYAHISRIIDTESKRLGVQVEKVLQMAVFDKGKIKLKIKETNLNELVSAALDNFNLQVKKRGGSIHWSPEATKAFVRVDEVHFTNVISNLLDNAMKYCNESPEIFVSSHNTGNEITLRVKDNGIGISRENQKRIFEKFYRVPTGNVHNVKGFGLGLSYVKQVVDLHSGSIVLKSELNKGTIFDITLPLSS